MTLIKWLIYLCVYVPAAYIATLLVASILAVIINRINRRMK